MKLSLKVKAKWLDFLDGLTELNANDVMWQWMEIYLDQPLTVRESLWVKYTHKKYGEHTHEILFEEDGTKKLAKAYIPPEVIKIPGEWSFQAFIRQYSTTDTTKYTQSATNIVTFTVANGLPLDGNDAPVSNATVAALYESAKLIIEKGATVISAYDVAVANGFKGTEAEWLASLKGADGHSEPAYIEEIKANDARWETIGTNYQVRILKEKHGFSSIHSVKARCLTGTGGEEGYEDMIYGSKVYLSKSVSVIVEKPMNIRVIIKGDR